MADPDELVQIVPALPHKQAAAELKVWLAAHKEDYPKLGDGDVIVTQYCTKGQEPLFAYHVKASVLRSARAGPG